MSRGTGEVKYVDEYYSTLPTNVPGTGILVYLIGLLPDLDPTWFASILDSTSSYLKMFLFSLLCIFALLCIMTFVYRQCRRSRISNYRKEYR
jgi:Na+/H+ antiporter NhaD/arsenite permease-like protein